LEGWVSLSFDVNKKGDVDNILVLDSSHKRVFDREAIRALKKWKYKPKMVDGLPKESIGLTEVLEFKLNNKKR
jgi:protein TonB